MGVDVFDGETSELLYEFLPLDGEDFKKEIDKIVKTRVSDEDYVCCADLMTEDSIEYANGVGKIAKLRIKVSLGW